MKELPVVSIIPSGLTATAQSLKTAMDSIGKLICHHKKKRDIKIIAFYILYIFITRKSECKL